MIGDKKIDSKENRIVLFNANEKHYGTNSTNCNNRMVINFNYFNMQKNRGQIYPLFSKVVYQNIIDDLNFKKIVKDINDDFIACRLSY
jgi:hypothetical protein